jgi:hypothetical protein
MITFQNILNNLFLRHRFYELIALMHVLSTNSEKKFFAEPDFKFIVNKDSQLIKNNYKNDKLGNFKCGSDQFRHMLHLNSFTTLLDRYCVMLPWGDCELIKYPNNMPCPNLNFFKDHF